MIAVVRNAEIPRKLNISVEASNCPVPNRESKINRINPKAHQAIPARSIRVVNFMFKFLLSLNIVPSSPFVKLENSSVKFRNFLFLEVQFLRKQEINNRNDGNNNSNF